MAETKAFRGLKKVWDVEALYARDLSGNLIRETRATFAEYAQQVTVTIDGEPVVIDKARPSVDALGDVLLDADGRTVPRRCTILDAARELYAERAAQPIPTLCHLDCLEPAAVCRVCSVEAHEMVDGRAKRALVPACRQPVREGMIVHTLQSPDDEARERVTRAVKVLVDLLAAEHLAASPAGGAAVENELVELARRVHASPTRYAPRLPAAREHDDSSPLMTFDRDACILCNRCIRACNEVKENHVLGRAGKGYASLIAFDLDDKMLTSSCVSCGECMISCPTSAMTFRAPVDSDWRRELLRRGGYAAIAPEELREHVLFRGFPLKYLQWNQGAVVKRRVERGDVLCYAGEYGATAFILGSGSYGIWIGSNLRRRSPGPSERGWLARRLGTGRGEPVAPALAPADERVRVDDLGSPDAVRTPADLLCGEMSCMNDERRTATVVALEDGEIYIIRRNILAMLERSSASMALLKHAYTARALATFLDRLPLFKELPESDIEVCREYLRGKVQLGRVQPGQTILAEGEIADKLYVVYIGHVKVTQRTADGGERVLKYFRPNSYFGEFGLVADTPRSATCSALDHVELIEVLKRDFLGLLEAVPSLKPRFHRIMRERLAADDELAPHQRELLREFVDQGLYNAQKLLVIDLEACTRCDECVKACAATHGGTTRLVRDGLRFDKWLVASACRSCTDPYCLVGCPVDAIHRRGSHAIHIESHCIGCGTCAANCPYGNINMVGETIPRDSIAGQLAKVQQRATTCDLCTDIVKDTTDEVSCVHACPHDAAFRMDGATLLARVGGVNPE